VLFLEVALAVLRRDRRELGVGVLELGLGLGHVALGESGLGLAQVGLDRLGGLHRTRVVGVEHLRECPEGVARLGVACGEAHTGEADGEHGSRRGHGDQQARPALAANPGRLHGHGGELGFDQLTDGLGLDVAAPRQQQLAQLVVAEAVEIGQFGVKIPCVEAQVHTAEPVEELVVGVDLREVGRLEVGDLGMIDGTVHGFEVRDLRIRFATIVSITHSDHLLR
jgi:hypothetical protein